MDSFLTLQAGVEYDAMEILNSATHKIATIDGFFANLKGIGVVCQVRPNGKAIPVGLFKLIEKDDLINYKEGFNILMEYFESIPDEEKADVDERLTAIGL